MKLDTFRYSIQNAIEKRNIFIVISLGLVVALIFSTVANIREAGSSRTYLIPTNMRQVGWLDKRGVSASYLTEMAREMLGLFLNATKENAGYREQQILRLAASEDKGDLKQFLMAQKKILKNQDVSTVFFPKSFTPDTQQLSVTINGSLHRYVGNQGLPPLNKTYVIQFRYRNGLLLVSQLNEVVKAKS